jgi:hypothetical protein
MSIVSVVLDWNPLRFNGVCYQFNRYIDFVLRTLTAWIIL